MNDEIVINMSLYYFLTTFILQTEKFLHVVLCVNT